MYTLQLYSLIFGILNNRCTYTFAGRILIYIFQVISFCNSIIPVLVRIHLSRIDNSQLNKHFCLRYNTTPNIAEILIPRCALTPISPIRCIFVRCAAGICRNITCRKRCAAQTQQHSQHAYQKLHPVLFHRTHILPFILHDAYTCIISLPQYFRKFFLAFAGFIRSSYRPRPCAGYPDTPDPAPSGGNPCG